VFGLDRGFCLMVGCDDDAVWERLEPIFRSLAPGVAAAPRTPGASPEVTPQEQGYLRVGPVGAGHFVKMVHNGIEYALMEAYAEGINVLHHANIGGEAQAHDAETAPLGDPAFYRYDIDIAAVAELWRRGSVVASWLLDLAAAALHDSPTLDGFAGHVADSGEGRWTAIAAIEEGVPADVLTAALAGRAPGTRFAAGEGARRDAGAGAHVEHIGAQQRLAERRLERVEQLAGIVGPVGVVGRRHVVEQPPGHQVTVTTATPMRG